MDADAVCGRHCAQLVVLFHDQPGCSPSLDLSSKPEIQGHTGEEELVVGLGLLGFVPSDRRHVEAQRTAGGTSTHAQQGPHVLCRLSFPMQNCLCSCYCV